VELHYARVGGDANIAGVGSGVWGAGLLAACDKMTNYLRCSQCSTPLAEVQNGCLVITAKHHGEKHTTVIPINDLVRRYCAVEEKERKLLRALQRGPALAVELAATLYCYPEDIAIPLNNLEGLGLVRREEVRGRDMFTLMKDEKSWKDSLSVRQWQRAGYVYVDER